MTWLTNHFLTITGKKVAADDGVTGGHILATDLIGATGPAGAAGPAGPAGQTGATGAQGPSGTGTGTVNTGTTNKLAFYAANGTVLSPLTLGTNLAITGTTLDAAGGGGSTAFGTPQVIATSGTQAVDTTKALVVLNNTTGVTNLTLANGTVDGQEIEIVVLQTTQAHTLAATLNETSQTLGINSPNGGVSLNLRWSSNRTSWYPRSFDGGYRPADYAAANALDGTELITAYQGTTDKKATAAQIKAFSLSGFTAGASQLYAGSGTAGIVTPITLGANLSLSGSTLNAAGGGGGGSTPPANTANTVRQWAPGRLDNGAFVVPKLAFSPIAGNTMIALVGGPNPGVPSGPPATWTLMANGYSTGMSYQGVNAFSKVATATSPGLVLPGLTGSGGIIALLEVNGFTTIAAFTGDGSGTGGSTTTFSVTLPSVSTSSPIYFMVEWDTTYAAISSITGGSVTVISDLYCSDSASNHTGYLLQTMGTGSAQTINFTMASAIQYCAVVGVTMTP